MPESVSEPRAVAWAIWAGVAVTSFAYLERRAIQSEMRHATLSRALAARTRKSPFRRALVASGLVGSATWFAYHVGWEPYDDATGAFVSYVKITTLRRKPGWQSSASRP